MDWLNPILAQEVGREPLSVPGWFDPILQNVTGAALFGLVGLVLYAIAYTTIRKMAKFSIEKEIAEDQNVALGILLGAMMLGIAIIVAAAIH